MTPTRRPEKSAFRCRTAAAPATPEGSIRTFILSSIQHKEIVVSNDVDYDIHREVAARLKIPF